MMSNFYRYNTTDEFLNGRVWTSSSHATPQETSGTPLEPYKNRQLYSSTLAREK